jgi:FkbM family methyltransferase
MPDAGERQPIMVRSLWTLRSLCPGPLAHLRLVAVYARLLAATRRGGAPIRPLRLRLRLDDHDRDWWVADPGEVGALWELFIAEEYGEYLPADAKLVIDAGANVGTATVWFRLRFPQARIVAVEPDPGALERLRRNVGDDPGVEIVQAALSDHDGTVRFARGPWTNIGHVVDGDGPGTVAIDALSLETLRERVAPGVPVDVLKIDTEGSEWTILTRALDGVATVAMEIHEPTPDGREPDAILAEVAVREGLELRNGRWPSIRWLLRG